MWLVSTFDHDFRFQGMRGAAQPSFDPATYFADLAGAYRQQPEFLTVSLDPAYASLTAAGEMLWAGKTSRHLSICTQQGWQRPSARSVYNLARLGRVLPYDHTVAVACPLVPGQRRRTFELWQAAPGQWDFQWRYWSERRQWACATNIDFDFVEPRLLFNVRLQEWSPDQGTQVVGVALRLLTDFDLKLLEDVVKPY